MPITHLVCILCSLQLHSLYKFHFVRIGCSKQKPDLIFVQDHLSGQCCTKLSCNYDLKMSRISPKESELTPSDIVVYTFIFSTNSAESGKIGKVNLHSKGGNINYYKCRNDFPKALVW